MLEILLFVIFVIIIIFVVYAFYVRKSKYKSVNKVVFDEMKIQCIFSDGTYELVLWKDLVFVLIETTDGGPLNEDLFWILGGKGMLSGCVYPGSVEGSSELLEHMQKTLDGFDNSAVIEASMSIENKKFLIWKSEELDEEIDHEIENERLSSFLI